MTREEIQDKALDLFNALVEDKSGGLLMKFENGLCMNVEIYQNITDLFKPTNSELSEGVKE